MSRRDTTWVIADLERQLAASEAARVEEQDAKHEAQGELASATDLANSWARESGVPEAYNEAALKGVIDRLWSKLSVEKAKAKADLATFRAALGTASQEAAALQMELAELRRQRNGLERDYENMKGQRNDQRQKTADLVTERERWDWWFLQRNRIPFYECSGVLLDHAPTPNEWRAAIDSARKKEKESPRQRACNNAMCQLAGMHLGGCAVIDDAREKEKE